MTGRCKFGILATLTLDHSITANIYSPWLKAKVASSLAFVNKQDGREDQRDYLQNKRYFESNEFVQSNKFLLDKDHTVGQRVQRKTRPSKEIQAACEMSKEVNTLNLALMR